MISEQKEKAEEDYRILRSLEEVKKTGLEYLEHTTCKQGNQCTQLCASKDCAFRAAVCANFKCTCREDHDKVGICCMGSFPSIVQKIQGKLQSLPDVLTWINAKYDRLIDWISQEREKVLLKIRNYGLSETQMTFLTALYAAKSDEIKGRDVYNVVKDLNPNGKKIQLIVKLMQEELEKYWQNCFNVIQKEVQGLNQMIEEAPQRNYKATILNNQSALVLDSKVVVTEVERATVNEMLNSSDRKVEGYELLYRASENDFIIWKFWEKCDHKADTVILIRTEYDKAIGGYTPLSWKKSKGSGGDNGEYEEDSSLRSFVFSVTERAKFTLKESHKQYAVKHNILHGPRFGAGFDIAVQNNARNANSWADIGCSYENSKVQQDTKEA